MNQLEINVEIKSEVIFAYETSITVRGYNRTLLNFNRADVTFMVKNQYNVFKYKINQLKPENKAVS